MLHLLLFTYLGNIAINTHLTKPALFTLKQIKGLKEGKKVVVRYPGSPTPFSSSLPFQVRFTRESDSQWKMQLQWTSSCQILSSIPSLFKQVLEMLWKRCPKKMLFLRKGGYCLQSPILLQIQCLQQRMKTRPYCELGVDKGNWGHLPLAGQGHTLPWLTRGLKGISAFPQLFPKDILSGSATFFLPACHDKASHTPRVCRDRIVLREIIYLWAKHSSHFRCRSREKTKALH